ncbi:DUF2316 family protein [Subtercola lobariae]|uniref:DUF2316 family protein n=1 Tax=Subtercola lobariae TaxID=1588641 RepID=A0A917F147_9MICO|nr:DUF2316 family protein [Subtercola lobariae]GGF34482.1 hypothetical protein GCM10011399_29490 [Subtercola lobariae]
MSLTRRQIAATRDELAINLARSGLSAPDVAAALHLDLDRVHASLTVNGESPRDVWLIRDYLEHTIRLAGGAPHPYSSLTDEARASARGWFGIADLDEVLNRVDG